jgi:hypothetical protein
MDDRFDLVSGDGSAILTSVPLESLQDMSIGGQSLTRGGGFFGGGFGAKGAVEGIAIASILNSLTTKKRTWVTIDLVADNGWVQFQLDGADTLDIRNRLRVLADAVLSRHAGAKQSEQEVSQSHVDIVSALERLVNLLDTGALTEQEFQLAKERLLQSP